MIRRAGVLAVLGFLAAAGCASRPGPTEPVRGPAASPEAIAERFLAARRDGRARVAWDCFAGRPQGKRIYLVDDPARAYRTREQFEADLAEGWSRPALAPATVWERTDRWKTTFGVALVYRQGTEEQPDRGSIELHARPVDGGWMLEAVGAR